MADTYTWLNTGNDQDWAPAANWNPGTGPPVAGDTVIFDGNETDYTDGTNFNTSAPTANIPGLAVNVTITGGYTYAGGAAEIDLNMIIEDLVINNAGDSVGLATGCSSLNTAGEVTNLTGNDITVGGNVIIQTTGHVNAFGDGLGTGSITCATCTNNGTITTSGDGGSFVVSGALTAAAASIIQGGTNGLLDAGSFVTTGASAITLNTGDATISCAGDFNLANNILTWTTTYGDVLLIDGNGSVSLGGGSADLIMTIDADATMIAAPTIEDLEIVALRTFDGGSLGLNAYGELVANNTSDWVDSGIVTQKADGAWTITDTDIVLDQINVDAAVTVTLAAAARCLRAEIPAGAVLAGSELTFLNPGNDFANLEGTINSNIVVDFDSDIGNSMSFKGANITVQSGGQVFTQTGDLNCDGTVTITGDVGNALAVLRIENGCDLNAVLLGGTAGINLPGKIILNGTCEIGSIARNNAANTGCGIDFGNCNLYMNGGTLVGTGLLAVNNENMTGVIYQGLISNLDMSSASPLLAYTSTDSGGNTNVIFSDGAVLGLINAADYKIVADYYADARDRELLANGDLFDAVYYVVSLDQLAQEIDLLQTFWDTYLITANFVETPSGLMPAVTAINNHVIVRGSYEDINEYFADNAGLTIDATWQSLSADAGYDISDTYVG